MDRRALAAATCGALAAGIALFAGATPAAAGGPYASPCDGAPQLPMCVAALGPILDVTAAWRAYQPALIQPVPISDYATDPEDGAPPLGVGACGGETSSPSTDGTPIPTSTAAAAPPAGTPAPPGTHGPYCLLRYIPGDFTPPCAACHRLFIDYAAIPASGTATSPPADGHWAGRLQWSRGQQLAAQINGHSPNIKNLCSDKFVNPAPGATCSAPTSSLDASFLEVEGDSSIYHHFPLEGRYYNGPAYLAGDGHTVAYHWVVGAFLDVDASAVQGEGTVWYQIGYRGLGDLVPDTDQSYGCLCEVPPAGHAAISGGYTLRKMGRPSVSGTPATSPAGSPAAAPASALPGTAAKTVAAAAMLIAVPSFLVLTAALRVRRRLRPP